MKLMFICGAGIVSGKEFITLELMKNLGKNHKIMCIMSDWGSKRFAELLEANNIEYKKIRLGFISKTVNFSAIRMTLIQLWYYPLLVLRYQIHVRKFKPDVIIHTNFHHIFLLYPLLKKSSLNLFHIHEIYESKNLYRKIFRLFSNKTTVFIGVSNAVTKSIIELGIEEKKVQTIYNGLTINGFNSTPETKIRSPFRIGIIGQIAPWKGHENLISALSMLKKDGYNFICLIYGEGEDIYLQVIKKRINACNLTEEILFNGFEIDKGIIYNSIDICCVLSTKPDPLPTTAIEAAYFCRPVIGSKSGGLPEIIEDGATGVLVEPDNINQIYTTLKKFLEQPELIKKMGRAAQLKASKKFNSKEMTKKFEELIQTWVN